MGNITLSEIIDLINKLDPYVLQIVVPLISMFIVGLQNLYGRSNPKSNITPSPSKSIYKVNFKFSFAKTNK